MGRRLLLSSFVGVFPIVAACGVADAETQTLSMSVDATPLVLDVGDRVTIRTDATGQSLFRVVVDYGDGLADSTGTVGSEYGSTRTHTYTIAGERTIRATAFDALLGETFDQVTVMVQDTAP